MPSKWSSTAHENSSIGQTLYFFPTRGCFLSETLNKTLSLNAGFGCCIEVLRRRTACPSLNLPACIFSKSFSVSFTVCFLHLQFSPAFLFARRVSASQVQT